MVAWAWIAPAITKTLVARLVMLLVATPSLMSTSFIAMTYGSLVVDEPPAAFNSKLSGSKVTLRISARRFAACLSRDDVDLNTYVEAKEEFLSNIERFGEFTFRAVSDARENLRRIEQARSHGIRSMRQLLVDQVQRGARSLQGGGPARGTGSEALLWSRLGLSMWVEVFKEQLRSRMKTSLSDATKTGFQRSMARYFDRFGRAAFNLAARNIPDWDVVRRRTHLGCGENGVCSDEELHEELRSFVEDVEPVLERMTELHKAVGLEDPRTP